MKIAIRRNTEFDVRKSTYSVEYWREHLDELIKSLEGESFIGCLIKGDSYYDSHQGQKDYKNLTMKRASLIKTQRACEALEVYLKKKSKTKKSMENVLKRQGLL